MSMPKSFKQDVDGAMLTRQGHITVPTSNIKTFSIMHMSTDRKPD